MVIGAGRTGSRWRRRIAFSARASPCSSRPRACRSEIPKWRRCSSNGCAATDIDILEGVQHRAGRARGGRRRGDHRCRRRASGAIEASHLLVAAGRRPSSTGSASTAPASARRRAGLVLDRRLRTTNRRVYAVGDAAGGPQSSHAAALPGRHRHPQHAVPASRQGRLPRPATRHLYRAGAGAGRPDRKRGAPAIRRRHHPFCARRSPTTTAPMPSARPRGWSRS